MSEITAVGPALDINGPLPVAPPYSLLSVPDVLVEDGNRWMNGVNVYGYPEDVPSTWEPCSTGTFRVKGEGEGFPTPRFDPIAVYVAINCTAMGIGEWEEFRNRAAVVLDATQSFGIEEALSQGVIGSTNPFFGDGNLVALAGGAAVTPEIGLRYLEDAIGATGRMGKIHATPSVVAAWEFEALETGEVLRTPNGTPVVSVGGYIRSEPVSEASPAAGQSWVFATGPVEVRLSEIDFGGDDLMSNLDQSINDVVVRAEKYALAIWDTALQVGVLID